MSLPYEVDFDDARKLKFLDQQAVPNWLDLYLSADNLASHFEKKISSLKIKIIGDSSSVGF